MCPIPTDPHLAQHEGVSAAPADEGPPPNRSERRHPDRRIVGLEAAAVHFRVSPATLRYWVRRAYVTGYVDPKQALHLDLDEVEAALRSNPRMRDGRRSRYGAEARIVPLPAQPVRAEVVPQPEGGKS